MRALLLPAAGAAAILAGCLSPESPRMDPPESGGATTIHDVSSAAFSAPAPNLDSQALELHRAGDAAFEAKFVTAPAPIRGGLGPVFNNVSCVACHAGDGRGRPPADGEALASMLVRLSVPGADTHGGPLPVPGYGGQLQPRAVFGASPEAQVSIAYRDSVVRYADGAEARLRIPSYGLADAYAPLPEGVLLSPRVSPPVFGLGLLEAVEESAILAHADPDDRDGDGISGKANYAWDEIAGKPALGRFGWKANTPGLLQQCAAAYNNDMGITSYVFPRETCYGQSQGCEEGPPEVDSATLQAVAFYVRTLAVPARRGTDDPEVRRGGKLFAALRCAACHLPDLRTGGNAQVASLAGQGIHPYTDLLLHDMGEGLSDGRPDFRAEAREWRTPPLWGIGLTSIVNGHTQFLHDGRARDLAEAVLWHGGEAAAAKDGFLALPGSDRKALLAFLNSL